MTAEAAVRFLPSWSEATDPNDDAPTVSTPSSPGIRTCGEDGAVHFGHLKQIGKSAKRYLHAVNNGTKATPDMLIGSATHQLLLQARPGKRLVRYEGEERKGNAWKKFAADHAGADILTSREWSRAEALADAVRNDPLLRARLDGARYEVPLVWEESGVKCATGGVDVVGHGAIGELKGTSDVEPERLKRHAFRMSYHCQLAWYRRGARANGIDVSNGLFILAYEVKPPFEVVDLELTEQMIELADRTVSLWLEKYRACRDSAQWPGYAQSPIAWDVPGWIEEEEDEEEGAAEAA